MNGCQGSGDDTTTRDVKEGGECDVQMRDVAIDGGVHGTNFISGRFLGQFLVSTKDPMRIRGEFEEGVVVDEFLFVLIALFA